jgi:Bax protein
MLKQALSKMQKHPRAETVALVVLVVLVASGSWLALLLIRPLPDLIGHSETPQRILPDFQAIADVEERKDAFFQFMYPFIVVENNHVLRIRNEILHLAEKHRDNRPLGNRARRWLEQAAAHYGVDLPVENPQFWQTLLNRVDCIPPAMALAQAALESGWGTSRFAKRGLNLFGQWCFSKGCGLVPKRRRSQQLHEVASYPSVDQSVQSYIHNLNTLPAYKKMREIREVSRSKGKPPDSLQLIRGLKAYSAQGNEYIHKLSDMIVNNNLDRFDHDRG